MDRCKGLMLMGWGQKKSGGGLFTGGEEGAGGGDDFFHGFVVVGLFGVAGPDDAGPCGIVG